MQQAIEHPWNLTPAEAVSLQNKLRQQVELQDRLPSIKHVAGVDVGFEQDGRITRAAVIILSFPELEVVEKSLARVPTTFPYIPGLLSFRELPAILSALRSIKTKLDILLCDGQGIAHPRRFGIASHLGVLLNVPTIGVAKTRLVGRYAEPAHEKGSWSPLMDGEETIGAVLRTRAGVKPVYVSSGHRVSLKTAIKITLACTTRYRLPETTRQAHHLASLEK